MNNIKPSDRDNEIYIFSLLFFIWLNKEQIDEAIKESYYTENEEELILFLIENYINGSQGIMNNNFLPGDINSLYNENELHILEVKSGKDYKGVKTNYLTDANAFGGNRNIFLSSITDVSKIINNGKYNLIDINPEDLDFLNQNISGNINFSKEIRYTTRDNKTEINKLVSKIEEFNYNSIKISEVKMSVERYYKFTDLYLEQNYSKLRIVNNDNQYKGLDITTYQEQIEKIKDNELLMHPNANLLKWNNEIDIGKKIAREFNKNSDVHLRRALTTAFFAIVLLNTPEDFEEIDSYESYIELLYNEYIKPIKEQYEIADFNKTKIINLLKDVFKGGIND